MLREQQAMLNFLKFHIVVQ